MVSFPLAIMVLAEGVAGDESNGSGGRPDHPPLLPAEGDKKTGLFFRPRQGRAELRRSVSRARDAGGHLSRPWKATQFGPKVCGTKRFKALEDMNVKPGSVGHTDAKDGGYEGTSGNKWPRLP